MLYHYHGGTGTQYLGDADSAWRVSVEEVIGITDYSVTVDFLYWMDGEDQYTIGDLYYLGDQITGLRARYETANSYTAGDFPFSLSEYFDLAEVASEQYLMERFMSGQDYVDGSSEGGSLNVWTHASDDYIRLHTGTRNNADAGSGNDYLQNWTWHAEHIEEEAVMMFFLLLAGVCMVERALTLSSLFLSIPMLHSLVITHGSGILRLASIRLQAMALVSIILLVHLASGLEL